MTPYGTTQAALDESPHSTATLARAYVYARLHGHAGLRRIAEQAVLNANYLKAKLENFLRSLQAALYA